MLKLDQGFTIKTKGYLSLGCLAVGVLWVILWFVFPMLWYSVFFSSTIGSYVTLFLLGTVLTVPFCWLFTIITSSNIPFTANFVVNVIMLMATAFLYSAFRYSMWYVVAAAVIMHIAAQTFVIGTAHPYKKKKLKKMSKKFKNVSYEKITGGTVKIEPETESDSVPLIKKQPLTAIMWAALHTILIDVVYIIIFTIIVYTFAY